jgi:hypothetical protein
MSEKYKAGKTVQEIKAQLEALFKGGPSALAQEVFNNVPSNESITFEGIATAEQLALAQIKGLREKVSNQFGNNVVPFERNKIKV